MSKLRDQLIQKTAGLSKSNETEVVEPAPAPRPQSAPGMAMALLESQQRVGELERLLAQVQNSGGGDDIPVANIVPNPWQPRRQFDKAKLAELGDSIAEVGLLQPIVVRRAGDTYQIIAGERRWRAHGSLGRERIKAIVVEAADADMAVLALTENVGRDDLSDFEIGLALTEIEVNFPTRAKLAEAIGLSRRGISMLLKFKVLPDFIKEELARQPRLLGATAAERVVKALAEHGATGEEFAEELWPKVVERRMTQEEFCAALESGRGSATKGAANGRNIEKLFAGKIQAGSVTKDAGGFTVKFKAGVLSDAKEQMVREFIKKLLGEGAVE